MESAEAPAPGSATRLVSLDALRGFDMFWIVGAEGVVRSLRGISDAPWSRFLASQLQHARWAGFTFYDLIFPLFLFMVGISIVLSQGAAREAGAPLPLGRILRRGLLLYLLGVFCSGGVSGGWEGVRLLGVLPRIAICYTVCALLFHKLGRRGLVITCAALLAGYWALLTFVPVRDASVAGVADFDTPEARARFEAVDTWVAGKLEPGLNLPNHFDYRYLPGRKWDGTYDPEGWVSTLPAIASCLLGLFAGMLLRDRRRDHRQKLRALVIAGGAGLAAGYLWSLQFPIIKQLWTSSFVLVAGGWSCLLLALFYWIIDVRQQRRWATPFLWIGTNAITIYVADAIIDFPGIARRLVGGPIEAAAGGFGRLLVTLVALALILALVRFLYRRRIFLRV